LEVQAQALVVEVQELEVPAQELAQALVVEAQASVKVAQELALVASALG
jgi:hypothetical protein